MKLLWLTKHQAACVGGKRRGGAWYWSDDKKMPYKNFAKNYPKRDPGLDCLEFGGDGFWRNIKCDYREMGFICQDDY